MEDNDLRLWNNLAEDYHEFVSQGKDIFRENLLDKTILDLLEKLNGKKVLDAGCGQGYFASKMQARGAKVIAVDGSEKLVEIARKNYSAHDLSFLVHNLKEKLPFSDDFFDIVLANMVLMDFDPIEPAIKEFNRILKPGGRLIFSVLHPFFALGRLHKTFREKIFRKLPHYAISEYRKFFCKERHLGGFAGKTMYYHRPLEYYTESLSSKGFLIDKIKEPVFESEFVEGKNNFLKLCAEIPPFIVFRAIKYPPKK